MQLSKFSPQTPPQYIKQKMSDVIMMHQYRYLKINKPPILNNNMQIVVPELSSSFKGFQINVRLDKIKGYKEIKRKIIRKVRSQRIDYQMEKKAQDLLNLHLVYRLTQSVLESVQNKIPLPLSFLDTKEQGDYLPDNQKKQYPHFSNIIKPNQIPNLAQNTKSYLPRPRPVAHSAAFSIEQLTKFKVKHIQRFVKLLFEYGNEQFNRIADQLLVSQCSVKILYDFFNDYFDVEDKLDSKMRNEENRKKYLNMVSGDLKEAFQRRKGRQLASVYLPEEEQFVSLKQLRQLLNQKRQDSASSSSES